MYTKTQNTNKKPVFIKKNNAEMASESGGNMVKNTASEIGKIGTGIFDQLFGGAESGEYQKGEAGSYSREHQAPSVKKREFSVFNFNQYREKEVVTREIKNLTEEIKSTVVALKQETSELVKDAEKLSIETVSENPGIYHERFLQFILSLLRNLRAKVGESRTWMQALMSKKKKRGSLFAARSKSKGTQYSLSQELQNARSVQ